MTESALVNVNQARRAEQGMLQETQQATTQRGEELRDAAKRETGANSRIEQLEQELAKARKQQEKDQRKAEAAEGEVELLVQRLTDSNSEDRAVARGEAASFPKQPSESGSDDQSMFGLPGTLAQATDPTLQMEQDVPWAQSLRSDPLIGLDLGQLGQQWSGGLGGGISRPEAK